MKKRNARFRTVVFWLCGLIVLYFILLAYFSTPWPLIGFAVIVCIICTQEFLIGWLEKRRRAVPLPLPAERQRKRKPGTPARIGPDGEIPEQPGTGLEISEAPLSLAALLKGGSGIKRKSRR
jgi:hypothetical protein